MECSLLGGRERERSVGDCGSGIVEMGWDIATSKFELVKRKFENFFKGLEVSLEFLELFQVETMSWMSSRRLARFLQENRCFL
jgi:hypothetical protein